MDVNNFAVWWVQCDKPYNQALFFQNIAETEKYEIAEGQTNIEQNIVQWRSEWGLLVLYQRVVL